MSRPRRFFSLSRARIAESFARIWLKHPESLGLDMAVRVRRIVYGQGVAAGESRGVHLMKMHGFSKRAWDNGDISKTSLNDDGKDGKDVRDGA